MIDHKLPWFLHKGTYTDGTSNLVGFLRSEVECDIPFKLFHRSLRKTDKNL